MTELWIIIGYLSLLLALGIGASRLSLGTSKDFMLASHSIGPFLLLMSVFGTTMTAFAMIGSTGESFANGISVYGKLASSSGIIHSLCFFVLGVKLWTYGHKYGFRTQIQFFRDRLESDRIGVVLFPVLVGLVIPYLLIGIIGAGTIVNVVTRGDVRNGNPTFEEGTFPAWMEQGKEGFLVDGSQGGVPKPIGAAVICAVVLTYVFFGGMRATAWANAFQTCVFMALGVVTFYLLAYKLGGQETLWDNLRTLSENPKIPDEKITRAATSKLAFATYMFIPLSVGMFPHLFQHWLTAKRASTFKLTVVLHPIFILIVWAPCVLLGLWATGMEFPSGLKVPPPIAADPNKILPFMVNQMGTVLTGLLSAGVLAAIMSSLDSQFLCLGTIFTEDIVGHYGGRSRFSDRQFVWIARGFIVVIVAISYWLSIVFDGRGVFTLGVWSFSGFASLFPLAFASLYWPRLTKAGGYGAVLGTAITWLLLFWASGFGDEGSRKFDLFGIAASVRDETIVLAIGQTEYELMAVVPMILVSTLCMVGLSLVTQPPSQITVDKFFPPRRS
jgi:SSS family solute:Na+ symporter